MRTTKKFNSRGVIPQEWLNPNWKNLSSDYYAVKDCLGEIMGRDIGKVYIIREGIANVENEDQFLKRKKAYENF